jgi:thiamine pyrophosphate-dependent acetolactate synthase large subunit-like protein
VIYDQDFHFIDTRHEQAAVHMADAWGRITGQLGVCMYTTPGFANAIPGLTNALHSESPLLSIAGSADLSELGRGAMQEINQVGMAAPVVKESLIVHDARRIPDTIARAVRLAFSGRRGPVHITIPIDVQDQELDEDELRQELLDMTSYVPSLDDIVDSMEEFEAAKEAGKGAIAMTRGATIGIDGVEIDISSDRMWDEATYQALQTPISLFQDVYENRPDQHEDLAEIYSEDVVERAMEVGS